MSEARTVLAEFRSADRLLEAIRRTRQAGYHGLDAFAPFPVEGLHEALGRRPTRARVIMLVAAVALMVIGFGIQWLSAVYLYPFNSGGRPFNSWQVFVIAPYYVAILAATVAGILVLIVRAACSSSTTRCSRSRASSASPPTASSSRWRTPRARPTATSSTTSLSAWTRSRSGRSSCEAGAPRPARRGVALAACGQRMVQQKRYDTYEPSDFWSDGTSARADPGPTRVTEVEAEPRAARTATSAAARRAEPRERGGGGGPVGAGYPAPACSSWP